MLPQRTNPFVCFSLRIHYAYSSSYSLNNISISLTFPLSGENSRVSPFTSESASHVTLTAVRRQEVMPPTGSRHIISGGQDFQTHRTKAGIPLFRALACSRAPRPSGIARSLCPYSVVARTCFVSPYLFQLVFSLGLYNYRVLSARNKL